MKIKTIFCYLSALLLMSCSETYDEELGLFPTLTPRYLSTSTSSLNYSSASGEQSLSINSIQTPWKFENAIDWISLSSLSGKNSAAINVGVSENLIGDLARTGIIYLKADVDDWKYESPVSITQKGAIPSIILSQKEVTLNGKSCTGSVDVQANCEVSVFTDDDWIKVNYEDNKVVFSVTANENSYYRQGKISLVSGSMTLKKTLRISQAPASINASTESLVFNNSASEIEITINAESAWTAATSNSWIDITPTSGNAGMSKMKIGVSPNTSINQREGQVILSVGGSQRIQIPVRQRGIFIEVENSNIQCKSAGGTQTISVLSNTTWKAESYPEWITLDKTSGEGNGIIKVTASDNPFTTSRSGQIHFRQDGLSIDCTVNVTQMGKTFEVNSTVLNFEDKPSTQIVDIESDGTWYASSNDEWISVTPSKASGSSKLSVSVQENKGDSERHGSVSVRLGDTASTINVVQKGKYFTIDNSMLTYGSKGGDIKISISSNDVWTAKIEGAPSWLKLSATNGNGTADIIATASDNPSIKKRTATILFESANHQSVRVLVTQNARYLTVDSNDVLFYFKGGVSEPITISTDGKYKVTKTDSWFSVALTDNVLTVSAQENTTTGPRVGFITIELTDLIEGTLSLKLRVTQLNYGGSFIRKGYNPDENYDSDGVTSGNLTITTYGDDFNWDSSSSSSTKLSISTYRSDLNWDTSVTSGLTVSRIGYDEDKNYDNSSSSSGLMSKEEFGDDKNWN